MKHSVVFHFSDSVERAQGSFGTVRLQVSTYFNSSAGERTSNTSADLNPTTAILMFSEGVTSQAFELEVIDELVPEFEEIFELELDILLVDGDSDEGVRLGTFSSAMIVVPENDSPYGLFSIAMATREVEVAEDVPSGGEGGMVEVEVERRFGAVGNIQVCV